MRSSKEGRFSTRVLSLSMEPAAEAEQLKQTLVVGVIFFFANYREFRKPEAIHLMFTYKLLRSLPSKDVFSHFISAPEPNEARQFRLYCMVRDNTDV